MKKKKKRGEEFSMDGRLHATKIFAKFSHDAPLPMIKKKHLTIEQLNARRRKVWLTIAKKEIPKVWCLLDVILNSHWGSVFALICFHCLILGV